MSLMLGHGPSSQHAVRHYEVISPNLSHCFSPMVFKEETQIHREKRIPGACGKYHQS